MIGTNYLDIRMTYNTNNATTTATWSRGDQTPSYTYTYDKQTERFTRIEGPNSTNVVWSYTRDPYNLNLSQSRYDDYTLGEWMQWDTEFIQHGLPLKTERAYGADTTNAMAWSFLWDVAWDQPTRVVDPEGSLIDVAYTNASPQAIATSFGSTTFSYTTNGLISAITNANGNWLSLSYDGYGFPTSVVPKAGPALALAFNRLGYPESVTLPGDAGARTLRFGCNELGLVTNLTYPDGLAEVYGYDGLGRLTNAVDRGGRTTKLVYGPLNRIASVSRIGATSTNTLRLDYDNSLNTLRITDAMGRAVEGYMLDAQDRVVTVTNLESQGLSVIYALGSLVRQITRFDGTVVSNCYDVGARLSSQAYADETNRFVYYRNDLLRSASNRLGSVELTLDQANRLTAIKGLGPTGLVSYAYLPAGNLTNVASVCGTASWSYDGAERVSSIAHPSSIYRYTYNTNNGLAASLIVSNGGLRASYTYDVLDRLTQIAWVNASTNVLRRFEYSYNSAGMITNVTREDGSQTVYAYDDLDRLTGESRVLASGLLTNATTLGFDAVGGRTVKTAGPVTVSYVLPGATQGNRLTRWWASSALAQAEVAGWSSESIGLNPALGRLSISNALTSITPGVAGTNYAGSLTLANGTNIITAAIGDLAGNVGYASVTVTVAVVTNADYLYSAAGCLTNIAYMGSGGYTRSRALGWNAQYQLTSVKTNGATAETWQYDALGRRVTISDGATTNWLVYDGPHVIAETTAGGALLRSYCPGPGVDNWLSMTIHTGATAGTYYYLTDHLGTVHALASTNGVIVESYKYDAWGRVLGVYDGNGAPLTESAVGNRILWQGKEYSWKIHTANGGAGLYCFRARWYDPVTGRWLSNDPIGISGGLNQYVFCGNNPVNFRDPFGLEAYGYTITGLPVTFYPARTGYLSDPARWIVEDHEGTHVIQTPIFLDLRLSFLGRNELDASRRTQTMTRTLLRSNRWFYDENGCQKSRTLTTIEVAELSHLLDIANRNVWFYEMPFMERHFYRPVREFIYGY